MFDKLEDILLRFEEIMNQLSEPDVANDTNRFRKLMKEQSDLTPIVIVEIRAGAGGDEAALFAAEIYRMYVHFAEGRRWKVETMECEEIGIGGMKNVTFMISGQGAYSVMKYESGVHRVQRVPETESGGRIHTSTITVAVMPEAEDVDVVIGEEDIRLTH